MIISGAIIIGTNDINYLQLIAPSWQARGTAGCKGEIPVSGLWTIAGRNAGLCERDTQYTGGFSQVKN